MTFPREIPRYISDEEDNPECKSQLLLHRLQEQAKTRQLQKQEQNWPTSGQRKRLASGTFEEETNKKLKQTSKKKKASQEFLSTQSHREKNPRQHTCGAESLPEKGDDLGKSKNGGNSRARQGKIEAVEGKTNFDFGWVLLGVLLGQVSFGYRSLCEGLLKLFFRPLSRALIS